MKRKIFAGSTGIIEDIFVQDTSSTTGAGLSGLTHNTANLVAYYKRKGAAPVAFTLVAGTQGQHINSGAAGTGGGFVAIPNLSGGYEVSIPDAAVAAGARSVLIWLQGAANMATTPLEIELDAVNYQDAVRFGLGALPNVAAGANGGLPLGDASGRTTVGSIAANAVNAAALATDAVTEIQTGLAVPGSAMTLTTGERIAIANAVEGALINEADGQTIVNAIVGAIGNTNLDQAALVAAIRADIERNGGTLAGIAADYARRTGDYGTAANITAAQAAIIAAIPAAAPTAAQIRDIIKADDEWKTILAGVNGEFTFNPATGVLTLTGKDGGATLATLTVTKNSDGIPTARASA